MRDWASLDPGVVYDSFRDAPRETLRLEIALAAFFRPETPPDQKEEYASYLKRRIRPAVEALVTAEDTEKLEALERLGWLEDGLLDGFIRLAREKKRTASLVWLLRLKAERGCYHDREFRF